MRNYTPPLFVVHIFAAGSALFYAWLVAQSDYFQTGLQFVTPVLIIMFVHFVYLSVTGNIEEGFSQKVYLRSAQSSLVMAVGIFVLHILAPAPAQAEGASNILGTVLITLFCATVVALVGGVIALFFWGVFKLGKILFKGVQTNNDKDDNGHLFDFGSLGLAFLVLTLSSFEGLPNAVTFEGENTAVAKRYVDASPSKVWKSLETATSPSFRLPAFLRVFPRPVEVTLDEGAHLGAQRKVRFLGREGEGYLSFYVDKRNEDEVRFSVLSDTSPIKGWVQHKALTYRTIAQADGTMLEVSLLYERKLAPAWFFSPMIKFSTNLAMDVLARDVKARSIQ